MEQKPNKEMNPMKKLILVAAFALTAAISFTGCQTAEGFGEDMENAGESIQDSVD